MTNLQLDCISSTVTERKLHWSARPMPRLKPALFLNEMLIFSSVVGLFAMRIVFELIEPLLSSVYWLNRTNRFIWTHVYILSYSNNNVSSFCSPNLTLMVPRVSCPLLFMFDSSVTLKWKPRKMKIWSFPLYWHDQRPKWGGLTPSNVMRYNVPSVLAGEAW